MPGKDAFPHLFSPLNIGSLTLPTRFAMAPMTTNFATEQGLVTQQLVDHLEARARGGFGLVITENLGVHASGRVMPRMAMADRDECIDGLTRLARGIQNYGARAFAQISHCGRQSRSKFTGQPLRAPSAIACPVNRELPQALSGDEAQQAIEQGLRGVCLNNSATQKATKPLLLLSKES